MDEDITKKADRLPQHPRTIDLSDSTWDTPILLRRLIELPYASPIAYCSTFEPADVGTNPEALDDE